MDKLKLFLLTLLLSTTLPLSAGWAPTAVQDSLKVLYPSVKVVGWSTDDNYYVASFQYNGFTTRVWFTPQGQWMMKQTDWGNLDEVPTPVFQTFSMGSYSTDNVLDVTWVEFPRQASQVVVRIGIDNALTEYQLFYLTNGTLINARNVTNMSNILGASTFL